jgi:hypothetical protein
MTSTKKKATGADMALWVGKQSGKVYCTKHAGSYLQAAIQSRPKAVSHTTQLDQWVGVTAAEAKMLNLHDCETCNPSWWKK